MKNIQVLSSNVDTNGWMQEEFTKQVDPLNHPRAILSEFEVFEITLKAVVKKLKDKWFLESAVFVMSWDYEPEGGITEIERRAIRDSAEHCGAKVVYIISKRFDYDERMLEKWNSVLVKSYGKSSKKRDKILSQSNLIDLLR